MKYRYLITAAIIIVSLTAKSQVFDKISYSAYSGRNINPEYKRYIQNESESPEYFNSIEQARNIHHKGLFDPMFAISDHKLLNLPIWLPSYRHRPRYVLANVFLQVPAKFVGSFLSTH